MSRRALRWGWDLLLHTSLIPVHVLQLVQSYCSHMLAHIPVSECVSVLPSHQCMRRYCLSVARVCVMFAVPKAPPMSPLGLVSLD